MDRHRWMWWIAAVLAYPLLLAVSFVAGVSIFWGLEAFSLSGGSTFEIGFICVLAAALFAVAAMVARRRDGPRHIWVVPAVGLLAYVVYSVATFTGDPVIGPFPPSLVIISVSIVLFAAVLGTVAGTLLGTHRTSAST